MAKRASYEQLKEWLERRLGKEVPDQVWNELVRDRYATTALETEEGRRILVDRARRRLRRSRGKDDRHFSGTIQQIIKDVIPDNEQFRSVVMSDHWARHASSVWEVRSFRRTYLRGGTVSRQQGQRLLDDNANDKRFINEVQRTCERLNTLFGWSTRDALIFLMTGKAPLIEPIEARWNTLMSKWGNSARLTLSVDMWVSKSTIMRVIDRFGRISGQNAKRPIERKALELADLVSKTMFDDKKRPQRELMKEWNSDFPEWKYTDERHFARDCRRARRTILFMNRGAPELGPGDEHPGAF